MPVEIQSAWLQSILSGVFGVITVFVGILIGRTLERRDRARQKIIETSVSSTIVVNPDALGHISMSVDKGFVTGKSKDKGVPVAVIGAYNHIIDITNIGIEDIEKPEIDILFDDKAAIVEFIVNADEIPQDKIEIKQDFQKPFYRRIIPQYLNSHTNINISVLSINNKSANCNVKVGGIGIIHQSQSSMAEDTNSDSFGFGGTIIFFLILIIVGALAGFALSGVDFLNPSISSAEATRMSIDTAHQQAIYQLEEQLAAAQTEVDIKAIERQQELLDAQYQYDLKVLEQDSERRNIAFKTWMTILSFLGGAISIVLIVFSTTKNGFSLSAVFQKKKKH